MMSEGVVMPAPALILLRAHVERSSIEVISTPSCTCILLFRPHQHHKPYTHSGHGVIDIQKDMAIDKSATSIVGFAMVNDADSGMRRSTSNGYSPIGGVVGFEAVLRRLGTASVIISGGRSWESCRL